MPITLNLVTPDGSVAHALHVPTQWADVTLGQFVALHAAEPDDARTAAELLLGLEAGALNQLAADDVPLIATLLAFSQDVTPVTDLLPPPGQNYEVGGLPYGCLLLVQQHLETNAERPLLASLPYVLAVYRCQLTWSSTDRLAETLKAVLAAPVTEVWAEAQAFTAACRNWQPGTRLTKPTPGSPKTKSLTPTLTRRFLSGLGLPSHWMPLLAATS